MTEWAEGFFEIQDCVDKNAELKERILELISSEPIQGKVTEGGARTESLQSILERYFEHDSILKAHSSRLGPICLDTNLNT